MNIKKYPNVYFSLSPPSIFNCILTFFLSVCFVHNLNVAWIGMTVCTCEILLFSFYFVCHLNPKTHPQYPTQSPTVGAGYAFALLQTALEWTAKPDRCVWKASKEARGGQGQEYLYRGSFQADDWRAAELLCQGVPVFEVFQTVHLPLVLNAWEPSQTYCRLVNILRSWIKKK